MKSALDETRRLVSAAEATRNEELMREAKALVLIAEALEGLSDERVCAVMCSACAQLGHYGEAAQFAQLARAHRDLKPGGSR